MPKVHTRIKRKMRVIGRNRKPRPKTFKTEEAAKKYAESKGLKSFELQDLHAAKQGSNKFRVVAKQ